MTEHNPHHESITVWIGYRDERILKPFFCNNCGKCICEILGDVEEIVYGEPPSESMKAMGVRQVIKCNGTRFLSRDGKDKIQCKTTYYFS